MPGLCRRQTSWDPLGSENLSVSLGFAVLGLHWPAQRVHLAAAGLPLAVEKLHFAARGLNSAAQELHLVAQGLHLLAENPYLAVQKAECGFTGAILSHKNCILQRKETQLAAQGDALAAQRLHVDAFECTGAALRITIELFTKQ